MLKPETPNTDAMREKILMALEQVIDTTSPQTIKVMDVARFMGISHTEVYRYFKSKAALRNALAEKRLKLVAGNLQKIVLDPRPATQRVALWLDSLYQQMETLIAGDRELFLTYKGLAESSRHVVAVHTQTLTEQLQSIISDGVDAGDFQVSDSRRAAEAVFSATIRDHHPFFVSRQDESEPRDSHVLSLLIAGLKSGAV